MVLVKNRKGKMKNYRSGFIVWERSIPHWHARYSNAKERLDHLGEDCWIQCCRCKQPTPCTHAGAGFGEW